MDIYNMNSIPTRKHKNRTAPKDCPDPWEYLQYHVDLEETGEEVRTSDKMEENRQAEGDAATSAAFDAAFAQVQEAVPDMLGEPPARRKKQPAPPSQDRFKNLYSCTISSYPVGAALTPTPLRLSMGIMISESCNL